MSLHAQIPQTFFKLRLVTPNTKYSLADKAKRVKAQKFYAYWTVLIKSIVHNFEICVHTNMWIKMYK